jgi:GAF domain-containing protein
VTEREGRLVRAFVDLADTLVGDYDVGDFLHVLCERCVEIFDFDAVGVLLLGEHEQLRLTAASSEQLRVLELFEIQQEEGPCQDAYQTGAQVTQHDLRQADERWPRFAPAALDAGFRSVYAFPLRWRDDRIGALNMFRAEPGPFDELDIAAAQALADVAAIGILQQRALAEAKLRAEQLQHALNSRVVIEQAKGVIAERLGIDPEEAFERLRRHARNNQRRLHDSARMVVEGKVMPD